MISQGFKNYLKSISMGNLSTFEDNLIDVDQSPLSANPHYRNDKQNLSSINEQKRELVQKLKEYSDLTNLVLDIEWDFEMLHNLQEKNLKEIQGSVSREIYQHQSAIWELIVTEQNFLKQIQFIVEVYISVFERLAKDFFSKINVSDIFSNLKEVYRVSLEFWNECMHPVLKEASQSQYLLQSFLLKDGFIKIGVIMEPYILYCTEISKCRSYILTLEKANELFSEYTKWALEFEESNREILCDHLAKPFQRLTKYKILLQAIQKHSSAEEKADMQEMIEAVDVFVTRVNEKVEEKTLCRKLTQLANQMDSYDVIYPIGDDVLPIVNQFSKFDLTAPILICGTVIIRQLSHSSEIKLREGISKTIDIRLYLFTDILLITKPLKKSFGKMKIIKSPLILDRIRLQKISNNSFVCICLNEFNCISSLYHFSNGDSKKVDEWIQKIDDAVKHYSGLKQLITDTALLRDFQNSIPRVKVVESSPKQSRFKSQLSQDSIFEGNFKRKSPVERKQKNKKDNITYGTQLSPYAQLRERKNSQPTLSSSDINKPIHLSKSNSFQEPGQPPELCTPMLDNSEINFSTNIFNTDCSNHDLHILCHDNLSNNTLNVSDTNCNFKDNYCSNCDIEVDNHFYGTFSKSLNKPL